MLPLKLDVESYVSVPANVVHISSAALNRNSELEW